MHTDISFYKKAFLVEHRNFLSFFMISESILKIFLYMCTKRQSKMLHVHLKNDTSYLVS